MSYKSAMIIHRKKHVNQSKNNKIFDIYRYGDSPNYHDILKVAGILFMVVDHLGLYFFLEPWLRFVGRASAPIFFFLIGFAGKIRLRVRLIIYGIILSFTNLAFMNNWFWVNILLVFVLTLVVLKLFLVNTKRKIFFIPVLITLVALNPIVYPFFEYGTLGILIALAAACVRHHIRFAGLWLALALGYYFYWQSQVFNTFGDRAGNIFGFGALGLILWVALYYFPVITIKPLPKLVSFPVLLVSRYSLDVYFFHVILLQALSWHASVGLF